MWNIKPSIYLLFISKQKKGRKASKNILLYTGDEGLMAKLCKEAVATEKWAREHEEHDTERDCSTCELGSTTAFFASGQYNTFNFEKI